MNRQSRSSAGTAPDAVSARQPRWMSRLGWGLSTLAIVFLLFDAGIKLVRLEIAVETTVSLGYPAGIVFGLGVLTFACLVLYAVPRTAILGAILLTGLFGGAAATHLRVASPVFSHLLFGVYLGLIVWGGLWLREPRLRRLIPYRH